MATSEVKAAPRKAGVWTVDALPLDGLGGAMASVTLTDAAYYIRKCGYATAG